MIKLPQALLDEHHRHILLDGVTIIESCFYEDLLEDTAYTTEHELIFVRSGQLIVEDAEHRIVVQAGEALLAKRGTYFYFKKLAKIIGQAYESILFFIRQDFVNDFIQQYELHLTTQAVQPVNAVKIPPSEMMSSFIQSLLPYFNQNIRGKQELLRLKTFELLFQILNVNPHLLNYFFHLNQATETNLVQLMENNFTKNLSLREFAFLAGRSLASFKRDFKKVFDESPARWLKKRRLQLAHRLLRTTPKRPTDVYLEVGFADYAHFSRSFKHEYGISPSTFS